MVNYYVDFRSTKLTADAATGDAEIEVENGIYLSDGDKILVNAIAHSVTASSATTITIDPTLTEDLVTGAIIQMDDTDHDGLTPANSFNSVFGKIADSDEEKIIWVRRGHMYMKASAGFTNGQNTEIISWPNIGDSRHGDRTNEGVSAGWDDDIAEQAIVYVDTAGIQISVTNTTIIGFFINDMFTGVTDPADTAALFTNSDNDFIFKECRIRASMFNYFTTSGTSDFNRHQFIDCEIWLSDSMYRVNQDTNDHIQLGRFERTKIRFEKAVTNLIVDGRLEYNTYHMQIQMIDVDIYMSASAGCVFRTNYNNTTGTGVGVLNSKIDIRIHGEFSLEYVFLYAQGFKNSAIRVEAIDEMTIAHPIHMQVENSTFNPIDNSSFYLKNIIMVNSFGGNYRIVTGKMEIDGCTITDQPLNSSQVSTPGLVLILRNCKLNKIRNAAVTTMYNCTKTGDTDFFIDCAYGKVNAIGCDFSSGGNSGALIRAAYGGSVDIFSCNIGSGNLVSEDSRGNVGISKASPATWESYRGTTLIRLVDNFRDDSVANGSFALGAHTSGGWESAELGDGTSFGLEADIDENTSHVDIYCISSIETISIDHLNIVVMINADAVSTFTVEEDSSTWDNDSFVNPNPFKIRVPIDVSSAQKISVVLKASVHEINTTLFVDPILIVT